MRARSQAGLIRPGPIRIRTRTKIRESCLATFAQSTVAGRISLNPKCLRRGAVTLGTHPTSSSSASAPGKRRGVDGEAGRITPAVGRRSDERRVGAVQIRVARRMSLHCSSASDTTGEARANACRRGRHGGRCDSRCCSDIAIILGVSGRAVSIRVRWAIFYRCRSPSATQGTFDHIVVMQGENYRHVYEFVLAVAYINVWCDLQHSHADRRPWNSG